MITAYKFPEQKLSRSKKTKKWVEEVCDEIDTISETQWNSGSFTGWGGTKSRKSVNYQLYNGFWDVKDFKYVTDPYNANLGEFPADLTNKDIISPKVNLLIGEESKRPFNFRVINVNPEASNSVRREKDKLLQTYIFGLFRNELASQGVEVETEEDLLNIKEMKKYIHRDYADAQEIMGTQALNYILREQGFEEKCMKGWKHGLIAGEEYYYVGIRNSTPCQLVVNPLYFTFDKDPELTYVEDGQWARYEMYMTPSSIFTAFGDVLSQKEKEDIDKWNTNGGTSTNGIDPWDHNDAFIPTMLPGDEFGNRQTNSRNESHTLVPVVHYEWKTLRKIKFLHFIDEKGFSQKRIVDEEYEPNKEAGEYVKIDWIPEVWESIRVGYSRHYGFYGGPSFIVEDSWGAKSVQHSDMYNPYSCKLGYCGLVYSNENSTTVSLIDRMKPFQALYNITWYRLERKMASDKGKKFLMDVTQIPTSEGISMDKWLYYLDALDIAFINSQEEGNRGKPSAFNQFQAIDMGMASDIANYIKILDGIDSACGSVAGITKQREGSISTNELVGNTERAVIQSSHITEYYFYLHNRLKERVMTYLLDCARIAWRDGKQAQYVLDDMSRAVLDIDPVKFRSANLGVFASDSYKDSEAIDTLKRYGETALGQQVISFSDLAKLLQKTSLPEIEEIFEQSEQEAAERADAMEKAKLDSQERIEKMNIENREDIQRSQKEIQDSKNRTSIIVAQIAAGAKEGGDDTDDSESEHIKANQKDKEVQEKSKIEDKKIDAKKDETNKKMSVEREKMKSSEKIEEKKLKMEEKLINKEAEIMEREFQLKEKEMKMKMQVEEKKVAMAEKQFQVDKKKADLDMKTAKVKADQAAKEAKAKPTPKK